MLKKYLLPLLLCGIALLSACGGSSAPTPVKTVPFVAGEFTTNIKESKKVLVSAVTMDVADETLAATLEEKRYIVQDLIIGILRDQSEDDLKNPGVKDTLRQSLKDTINETFETTAISDVYFTKFVTS